MFAGHGEGELNRDDVDFEGNRRLSVVGHRSAGLYRICANGFLRVRPILSTVTSTGKQYKRALAASGLAEKEMVDRRDKLCVRCPLGYPGLLPSRLNGYPASAGCPCSSARVPGFRTCLC